MFLTKYLVCVTLVFTCGIISAQKGNPRAVRLTAYVPVIYEGKLIVDESSVSVFHYRNMVLYKIPVINNLSQVVTGRNGEIIKDDLTEKDTTYQYFLLKNVDTIGTMYDSLTGLGRKVSVDSFLGKRTLTNFDRFYAKKKAKDSLIQSYTLRDTLIQTYIPKVKSATSSDSTYLYFLKKKNYALSKMDPNLCMVRIFTQTKEIVFKSEIIPEDQKILKFLKKIR